jgi:hypothetical protein
MTVTPVKKNKAALENASAVLFDIDRKEFGSAFHLVTLTSIDSFPLEYAGTQN